MGMNPKASCGVLYPPLRGIVQLTNSAALRFRNWSFTINESVLFKNHNESLKPITAHWAAPA